MLIFMLRTGPFIGTRCRDRGGSCRSAGTGGLAEGCTSARRLYDEIRQRGYPGTHSTVREARRPRRPKDRDVTRWLLSHPGSLEEDEALKLKGARDRCPHLDALARHVTAFAEILTGLYGDRHDDWITAVEADDQPDLHLFTRGLRRDCDAARNGLTLQWSSGKVEGNFKVLKRQMYGHAGFDLLPGPPHHLSRRTVTITPATLR